jgi:hypothetical protein
VLVAGLALLGAVAVLVTLLSIVNGYDPLRAIDALWRGSLGSRYALLSATLVRATPLILTGLSVTLAFTAGVMNIGAEGQLLAGLPQRLQSPQSRGRRGGLRYHWLSLPGALPARRGRSCRRGFAVGSAYSRSSARS